MSLALRKLDLANATIEYRLKRTDRSTLAITVQPDGSVEVTAPKTAEIEKVEHRIAKRARWIADQQRFFGLYRPTTPQRRYVAGETHLYLGRQYRLRIHEGEDEGVSLRAGQLVAITPKPTDAVRVRELVRRWYRAKARTKLSERYELAVPRFERLGIERPTLLIRDMTRSWGSHSMNGRITLNRDLIRAPSSGIDYVVVHELCHAVHTNHGPTFFALLERMMPDWRRRKERLERLLA